MTTQQTEQKPVLLRDELPKEFFHEFMDSRAAKLLDCEVEQQFGGLNDPRKPWPGSHKNVIVWWKLKDGRAVGWNENDAIGWSFPVHGRKNKG